MEQNWLAEFRLGENETVRFRHVSPDDAPLIEDAIRTASAQTLLHRFFKLIEGVPRPRLESMLTIDRTREACIVGVLESPAEIRIICGARFVRDDSPDAAEIAVTVHDEFQRRGLGTFLLRYLTDLALAEGVSRFDADIMASNAAMLRLLTKVFPEHRRRFYGDGYRVRIDLERSVRAKNSDGEVE